MLFGLKERDTFDTVLYENQYNELQRLAAAASGDSDNSAAYPRKVMMICREIRPGSLCIPVPRNARAPRAPLIQGGDDAGFPRRFICALTKECVVCGMGPLAVLRHFLERR